MENKVINKYPENGTWEAFFGGTSVSFNNVDDAITEIGGYIEADGLSLRKVKQTCLQKGGASGEFWSVSYSD